MKWVLYVWGSALRGSFDIALRLFFCLTRFYLKKNMQSYTVKYLKPNLCSAASTKSTILKHNHQGQKIVLTENFIFEALPIEKIIMRGFSLTLVHYCSTQGVLSFEIKRFNQI